MEETQHTLRHSFSRGRKGSSRSNLTPDPQPFSKEPPAAGGDNFSFLCPCLQRRGRGGQAWWQEGNGSLTSLPLGGWAQQSGSKARLHHPLCAPPPTCLTLFFKPGLPPPGAPSEFVGLCLPSKQDPSIPEDKASCFSAAYLLLGPLL